MSMVAVEKALQQLPVGSGVVEEGEDPLHGVFQGRCRAVTGLTLRADWCDFVAFRVAVGRP